MSWPALLLWVLTFLNADVRVWTGGLDYLSDCSLNMQLQCSWDTVVIFLSERKHSAASIYRAVLKLWPDWPDKEDNQLCMLGPLSPVHFMASLFNFTQYIPRAMYSLSFSSHAINVHPRVLCVTCMLQLFLLLWMLRRIFTHAVLYL